MKDHRQAVQKRTVAAVIPTYNRSRLLMAALDSVLGQTRPADEVVIIDDGSSDDTAARVAPVMDRVRYLRQENRGKAAAVNHALATLNSDYVWIMDDDDIALPDALERHIAFLDCCPQVDFSYSGVYCFEGDGQPPPLQDCLLWQRPDIPDAEFFIRSMELFPANQQTMLVPRACYEAIGGFDEDMRFGEDYEAILQLARRFRAARLPEPTILLRTHSGDRGPAAARYGAGERRTGWRLYDKRIFAKLRRQLTLDEYLPRDSVHGLLTYVQRRRALLQRACIMARHGLYEEALGDLGCATSESLMRQPVTAAERMICGRMMDFNAVVLPAPGAFIRSATRLLRRQAPALVRPAMAGRYWSLRREMRAGEYRSAALSGSHLTRMLIPGVTGRAAGATNKSR